MTMICERCHEACDAVLCSRCAGIVAREGDEERARRWVDRRAATRGGGRRAEDVDESSDA